MLTEADFKSVYATGETEPSEFFLDALLNSNHLDLGLGYFSSSGFRALSMGFAFFIKRGGKMRMIINNILSKEDKKAIIEGTQKSPQTLIEENLIQDIIKLKDTLSKKDKHFFKCLSWLVATKKLEIKATIPKKSKVGIVHQKFGLFKDIANNKLAFTGSTNFSAAALINNVEALWCDFSWMNNLVSDERIAHFEHLFHKTWTGFSDVVEIIPLEQIQSYIESAFPVEDLEDLIQEEMELAKEEISNIEVSKEFRKRIDKLIAKLQPVTLKIRNESDLPALREYQLEAITNWKESNYRGIFEMATGTGKTYTALSAIWELIKDRDQLFIIISCPFIHLAEQWQEEARKFGLDSLLVGESKAIWEDEAARQSRLFAKGKLNRVVFITTNASFTHDNFQKIIKPVQKDTLLIIDEVHYAGAYSIRKALPADCMYRLGLSATPERHGDEEGTDVLFEYFGNVVYSFPIEKAIGKFLTPYYYHPIPVELTEGEFEEYCQLTDQIVRLAGKEDDQSRDRLEKLAIKRARVQNNSVNKLEWIRQSISWMPLDYSLFYAGDEIFENAKYLLGKELKVRIHEFTSRQSRSERKKLLSDFASQKIQSLMAMKCLDEGVDVPPTRVAYFLASSSNPREFVQRRGRVLRKYQGKDNALIYDLISIPPIKFIETGRKGQKYYAVKSAFAKEYRRVQEFASMAINKYDSMNDLFSMADQLDLLDITKE
ncbi:MAG TPA: DEAD/DEAH box helicase family protein [Candidatus Dojkabacteria bacterium]|nr:DEAD/DEAH box helicase family protein [Candidatus Dojkabacteria bacterium]